MRLWRRTSSRKSQIVEKDSKLKAALTAHTTTEEGVGKRLFGLTRLLVWQISLSGNKPPIHVLCGLKSGRGKRKMGEDSEGGKDSEGGEEPSEIEEGLCTPGREKSYDLCCLL